MKSPKVAPYGSWKSPITSDLIVGETLRLGLVRLAGRDTYWIESRPGESGRSAIVKCSAEGDESDLLPAPYNARTRVHEYGGGDYAVSNGIIYFSNFSDQRVYRLDPATEPQPITPEIAYRYADYYVDTSRQRLICVREDHSVSAGEPVNTLVSLNIDENPAGGSMLVAGNDFYASPSISPDGSRLAWLTWNHSNMPWDGTELWVAEFNADGALGKSAQIAGGLGESIFQPQWSPDGTLHFISDRTGWWNLYRLHNGLVEALCPKAAEFAVPQWAFALSTYGFAAPDQLICCYSEQGYAHLALLVPSTGDLRPFTLPYTSIGGVHVTADRVVFAGASATIPTSIVQLDLATGQTDVLAVASTSVPDSAYFSLPESIEFPTTNGLSAFAFYYAPRNADFVAPGAERPPLLVKSHGGPTAATSSSFDLTIQFWTSRGFAVLDVNYGGSTGYGRAYRERLKGNWGNVDVDDCVNGAGYLVERGLVDGNRLAIDGGSAGGYTTLSVLTFRDTFKVGASYYGVSDLEALATDTHKFESHYLNGLVGPYPERVDLYHQRSPIYNAERLSRPVIFFQGLDDKVVPPAQAERMVNILRDKRIPVAYLAFAGEGHGFRSAANIKRSLEAELYFFAKTFNFELADQLEPVQIENL